MSCISGTMTIIAKVTQSRRSWMNSLISIAQVRLQKKPRRAPPRAGPSVAIIEAGMVIDGCVSLIVVLGVAHEVDEDVLERRRGTQPHQVRPVAEGCNRRFERSFVAPRYVQAVAEGRDHV